MTDAPRVIGLPPNFQERVDALREVDTECPNFARIAQPYIDAADWERESGQGIEVAVGINQAVDIQGAATALSEFALNCAGCQSRDFGDCRLAEVDKMQPIDLINLLTQEK